MTEDIECWEGTPITELSREELIEVIKWLGKEHRCQYSFPAMRARALGHVEMLKRGEI